MAPGAGPPVATVVARIAGLRQLAQQSHLRLVTAVGQAARQAAWPCRSFRGHSCTPRVHRRPQPVASSCTWSYEACTELGCCTLHSACVQWCLALAVPHWIQTTISQVSCGPRACLLMNRWVLGTLLCEITATVKSPRRACPMPSQGRHNVLTAERVGGSEQLVR